MTDVLDSTHQWLMTLRPMSQLVRMFVVPEIERRVATGTLAEQGLPFQVLQFQNDLFTAEVRQNLAMVDYNKAQVELERVQGTLLEGAAIGDLATLPSREQLIATLAGALASPMQNFVNLLERALGNPAGILLNDSLRNLQGLLDARAGQMEEAA